MSKLTFDEMVEYMSRRKDLDSMSEAEFTEGAVELMNEILEVGQNVLESKPREQVAGMLTLVQTILFNHAMESNNVLLATLANTELFTDALFVIFQAAAGIMTMQEVR